MQFPYSLLEEWLQGFVSIIRSFDANVLAFCALVDIIVTIFYVSLVNDLIQLGIGSNVAVIDNGHVSFSKVK